MSVFEQLNSVNVNDKTEKKGKLTYLSWAWAWGEVKKAYPDATYTIYERQTEYGPVNYFTDGRTCWVKTGVTIEGLEHIEELPVMNNYNNPIPYESVTSTDVNKSIQRSITKACARHGLGLYIYAGEDLPEIEADGKAQEILSTAIKAPDAPAEHPTAETPAQIKMGDILCDCCKRPIKGIENKGKLLSPAEIIAKSLTAYGQRLCFECALKKKKGEAA